MTLNDLIRYTSTSALSHRLRSALTALGIGIGVTAVVILTSIGEGLQDYMLDEFTQFGTNIIAINPGANLTFGAPTAAINTERPLSIDDAQALERLPYVIAAMPMAQGNASVSANGRERRVTVSGVGPEMPDVFSFPVAMGEFLPPDDPRAPRAFTVLGSKVRDELYGDRSPLGDRIRIGDDRYRVVGVMESKGTLLGFDLDDTVYIPAARAMEMFDRESLLEIDILYTEGAPVDELIKTLRRVLVARHGGEDFTITTQQQMLDVLGSVLDVVTFAVGALGSISLLVGGVGIFTIMTIAVRERTFEIGLLRAVGAHRWQVRNLFIGESILLAGVGGLGGLLLGAAICEIALLFVPNLPLSYSLPYAAAAEAMALLIGLVAGVLPAQRAARMDPVQALRAE
ncbi:MAG: ABC transporter permease [Gammaproteobacteria bacterium]|nr:ABC transporter permease [Gammaproteobacteria bacterium]